MSLSLKDAFTNLHVSSTFTFNINSSISPMLRPSKNNVQIDTSELSSIRHAPIFRVALTGGPCSGKTSSMVVLQDRFRNMGWNVYVVPEAPTLVFGGGVSYPELPDQGKYVLELQLLKLKIALEDTFYSIAKASGKKTLILCDRGLMDGMAYTSPETWQRMLTEMGLTTVDIRDSRYECVIHLQTAANGALEFYTCENNSVRSETPQQAVNLDNLVKSCWVGHPYLYMIDNSTAFQPKVMRVVEAVSKFIGEDAAGIVKRKYLVQSIAEDFPIAFEDSIVEYHYITTADGSLARLRKRGDSHCSTYTLTIRRPFNPEQRIQLRRNIGRREHDTLLALRDINFNTVQKKTRSFVYNNINFELDEYLNPCSGLKILEAYVQSSHSDSLPPFITVGEDITNNPTYYKSTIAKK